MQKINIQAVPEEIRFDSSIAVMKSSASDCHFRDLLSQEQLEADVIILAVQLPSPIILRIVCNSLELTSGYAPHFGGLLFSLLG